MRRRGVLALVGGLAAAVVSAGALGPVAWAGAPEGRAYELVSPAHKNPPGVGGAVNMPGPRVLSDGDGILHWANVPLPGGQDPVYGSFMSTRGADSWSTLAMLPTPAKESIEAGFDAFFYSLGASHDGSRVLYWTGNNLAPEDTDADSSGRGAPDLYLRQPDGTFDLVTGGDVNLSNNGDTNLQSTGVRLADDGHVVVFQLSMPLLSSDVRPDATTTVYEWRDGQLSLVATDGAGNPMSADSVALGAPGGQLGSNVVSTDGSRIFFTIDGKVYVRDHGVVKSIAPGSSAGGTQVFEGATPDGGHAYFTTSEALTSDDMDTSTDLYDFNVATGDLRRVSRGTSGQVANVGPGVRVSDDGSVVYFQAAGQLGDAPSSGGGTNLYVSSGGEVHYVASVLGGDLVKGPSCGGGDGWATSGDGQRLVFASASRVTADDRDDSRDIFAYSLATGQVRRVSSVAGDGNDAFDASLGLEQLNCDGGSNADPTRFLSDDGRYAAFWTSEALAPRDTNGQEDVYLADLDTGTTQLVSSGTSAYPSWYLGMGKSGRDVFFTSTDPLVPEDPDVLRDIYDARVGGGFPSPEAPASCQDDSCQGASHGGLGTLPAPSSSTLLASPRPTTVGVTLSVARLTRAQLRAFARTGRVRLRVKASRSGTLTVVGRARVHGRLRTVVERVGTVRASRLTFISLTLSRDARVALRQQRKLTVALRVQLAGGAASKSLTAHLRLPRRPRAAAAVSAATSTIQR